MGQTKKQRRPKPTDVRKLWVHPLPTEQRDDELVAELHSVFEEADFEVDHVELYPRRQSAMVYLRDETDAERARTELAPEVFGQPVTLAPVRINPNPPGPAVLEGDEERAVRIEGLSPKLTSVHVLRQLTQLAETMGSVERAWVEHDPERPWEHRGAVVLTMQTSRQADVVCQAFEGRPFAGQRLGAHRVAEPTSQDTSQSSVEVVRLRPFTAARGAERV